MIIAGVLIRTNERLRRLLGRGYVGIGCWYCGDPKRIRELIEARKDLI